MASTQSGNETPTGTEHVDSDSSATSSPATPLSATSTPSKQKEKTQERLKTPTLQALGESFKSFLPCEDHDSPMVIDRDLGLEGYKPLGVCTSLVLAFNSMAECLCMDGLLIWTGYNRKTWDLAFYPDLFFGLAESPDNELWEMRDSTPADLLGYSFHAHWNLPGRMYLPIQLRCIGNFGKFENADAKAHGASDSDSVEGPTSSGAVLQLNRWIPFALIFIDNDAHFVPTADLLPYAITTSAQGSLTEQQKMTTDPWPSTETLGGDFTVDLSGPSSPARKYLLAHCMGKTFTSLYNRFEKQYVLDTKSTVANTGGNLWTGDYATHQLLGLRKARGPDHSDFTDFTKESVEAYNAAEERGRDWTWGHSCLGRDPILHRIIGWEDEDWEGDGHCHCPLCGVSEEDW